MVAPAVVDAIVRLRFAAWKNNASAAKAVHRRNQAIPEAQGRWRKTSIWGKLDLSIDPDTPS